MAEVQKLWVIKSYGKCTELRKAVEGFFFENVTMQLWKRRRWLFQDDSVIARTVDDTVSLSIKLTSLPLSEYRLKRER